MPIGTKPKFARPSEPAEGANAEPKDPRPRPSEPKAVPKLDVESPKPAEGANAKPKGPRPDARPPEPKSVPKLDVESPKPAEGAKSVPLQSRMVAPEITQEQVLASRQRQRRINEQMETRIISEMKALGSGEYADTGIKVEPIPGEKFQFQGTLIGPSESPYEGGTFVVHIIIPYEYAFPTLSLLVGCNSSTRSYPFKPPKVKFVTKVWHPNISFETGTISLGADVPSHALQAVPYAQSYIDTPIFRNTNTVHKHTSVCTHTHFDVF